MISQTDLELLNAYLDDALDQSERAALESRLASDPALRRELNSLRATAELVRALPQLRAPRDFTLTAADARRARTIAFPAAAISFVSAAASILLIIIGVALLNPASSSAPTMQTAAESRAFELGDTSDAAQSAEAAIAALPTTSPMPTQLPQATLSAMSGGAAAPPAPIEAQQNAMELTAVQEGEFFEPFAATVMLEEVQAQATQIAARSASTTDPAPIPDALGQPQEPAIADLAAGMVAPSALPTQTTLYEAGADTFASEASPPGYAAPTMILPMATPSPAGTSFTFRRDNGQETMNTLESAALATDIASPTHTPSVTPSSPASETPPPTPTTQPTLADDNLVERQQQESEMPIGAILIGIGVVIGIFAIVYFIRARR